MRRRGLPTPPTIVILALTFALTFTLGSFGTATAGGLTKAVVKKIAVKVVDKKAGSLTVASAATATTAKTADTAKAATTAGSADTAKTAANSTQLNGQPASAYQTPAYQFTITAPAATGSKTFTFPSVPAGTYLVSYAVTSVVNVNRSVFCAVAGSASGTLHVAQAAGAVDNSYSTPAASAVVTVTGTPQLDCHTLTGDTFYVPVNTFYPSTATFVRIDSVTAGSSTN